MASPSFIELPDDIQVNIFSFLNPCEISAVACTSRRFSPLPGSPLLWLAMCDRRWGQFTSPASWGRSCTPRRLYRALDQWENLIGFWRRIGHGHGSGGADATCHPLLFFQWNSDCITGSLVSPCSEPGSYNVVKSPFLWLGMSQDGDMVSYRQLQDELGLEAGPGSDPVEATVSFVGPNHLVIEPNGGFRSGDEAMEVIMGIESSSPPDQATLQMYQYFANRTSPCGEKGVRRQRRRERERRKSGLVTEHFVRITHYCPTPTRPLQGLWKGICENRSLEFYLVAYDDIGGITCRRVGEPGTQFSGYSPLFWTPNADFIEPPFSKEEYKIYTSREHLRGDSFLLEARLVSRILCINSSYDLVIPDLTGAPGGNLRNVEGRVWEYDDGTFGFGFLRNDHIVDLKHVALDGQLLDSVGKSRM
ncbi:hypothetical protein LUZ61_001237 [Rhynchospora tenuis]|uniref:F-box protein n=1 Tax=Rhynchospora tenuis TaxID=198213 RepID=A0AAD5ZGN3_9POAL|nr:hypothetical protein LUZ61_001237 [Rhynchospora tenuis]